MTDEDFVIAVAHILMSPKLREDQRLKCIRLRYLQMAFPEKELNKRDIELLESIYE